MEERSLQNGLMPPETINLAFLKEYDITYIASEPRLPGNIPLSRLALLPVSLAGAFAIFSGQPWIHFKIPVNGQPQLFEIRHFMSANRVVPTSSKAYYLEKPRVFLDHIDGSEDGILAPFRDKIALYGSTGSNDC